MSIRNLFNQELRRALNSRCLSATLGALILVFGSGDARLFAQQSNVERDQNGAASASSILSGVRSAKGVASGFDRGNSRFSGATAYGAAGNIVGLDGSAATRFNSADASFKSKQNYDLLRQRVALEKALSNAGTKPNPKLDNSPRLITAKKPPRAPYDAERRARYGLKPEELAEKARIKSEVKPTPENAPAQEDSFREYVASRNMAPPEQIWMRGRQPYPGSVRPEGDPWIEDYDPGYVDADAPYFGGETWREDGLGGGLHINDELFENSLPAQAPLVKTPTPAETRQAFQSYLETQLLRSPSVNPLSPIQVVFSDGTAVVRGVVPTPAARVAAGNILLADPRVQKVDNKLTFVRPDDPGLTVPAQSTPQQTNDEKN